MRRKTARRAWRFPRGVKVSVGVERNGAFARADGLPPGDAIPALRFFLAGFRDLTKDYDELVVEMGTVHSSGPLDVSDDDGEDGGRKRRVGF